MTRRSVARGVVAGLLAAAVLATWFLVIDVIKRQPLFTPAYMSGLVFTATTALPATARVVVFVLLHFSVFAMVGAAAAELLTTLRVTRPVYWAIPAGVALFAMLYFGVLLIFDVSVVRTLGWWELLIGNILAASALLAWLQR